MAYSQQIISVHQSTQYKLVTQVSEQIKTFESALRDLYILRAGKVIADRHGNIQQAWCSSCGEHEVKGDVGRKFCSKCEAILEFKQAS